MGRKKKKQTNKQTNKRTNSKAQQFSTSTSCAGNNIEEVRHMIKKKAYPVKDQLNLLNLYWKPIERTADGIPKNSNNIVNIGFLHGMVSIQQCWKQTKKETNELLQFFFIDT